MEETPGKVTLWLFLVIIVGLIAGGAGYWYANQIQDTETTTDTTETTTPSTTTPSTVTSAKTTKEVTFPDLGGEVTFSMPANWSAYAIPENIGETSFPDRPTASVAEGVVKFGDLNIKQVDFYFSTAKLSNPLTADADNTISEITIDGVQVTKLQNNIDGQEPDKFNPGGAVYFFNLTNTTGVKSVKIVKQGLGDAEFEADFADLIDSMQLN